MGSDDFISKQQFQAVHDHFHEVIDKAGDETKTNELQSEFRLLLNYFCSIYKESERKTHKILHLMTKTSKDKEKMDALLKRTDEEKEKLAVVLCETRKNRDELLRNEQQLIKEVEEMRENIESMKTLGIECGVLLNKTVKYSPSNFRDIGVETEELKDVKHEKQACRICSETNSTLTPTVFDELASQEKYKQEIAELNKKVNVLSTELKVSYKDINNIKAFMENSNKHLDELKRQLQAEKEGVQECISNKKSLQATIDKLVLDLYSRVCEIRNLQKELEMEISKRNTVILENKAKDILLENMKRKLSSLQERKEFESRKADIFEEQIVTDQERLLALQLQSDSLKKETERLKEEIRSHETQQKLQTEQQKWLEGSQKTEMTNQKRKIEHCQNQVKMRDKRIRSLATKTNESGRQIVTLRKELKDKVKENGALRSELSKVKVTVTEQIESLRNLKVKLEAMENSNVQLQAELKSENSRNEILLRGKNELHFQYKVLYEKFKCQEMNLFLLNKQEEYHRNALKISNKEVEKLSKKIRCASTKI